MYGFNPFIQVFYFYISMFKNNLERGDFVF